MKKFFLGLLLAGSPALMAHGEEVTLNFADLGLDSNTALTDYKINENLSISSTGNAKWNDSNKDFRLFTGGGLSVTVTDATLTGISIVCNSGYGFGVGSTVTADSSPAQFTADPFSWEGDATESWTISAAPASNNVRMESITFTYTAKAVSETLTCDILSKDMDVTGGQPIAEGGYDVNEYVNINFEQGTHANRPNYNATAEAFYLFSGQELVISAKDGAKLLKIVVATAGSYPFGFMTTVTADGVAQTNGTDFTLSPQCEWNGSAEQQVVFQNTGVTGNTRVTGITVTYETPGEGLVVSRPVITQNDSDNLVAITCDTEDASIYYTLDGTDPTDETGTLYEAPFELTDACTIKAIAMLDGVYSSVASLDAYLRIVDSLAQFYSNASSEVVKIECPVTAITWVSSYVIVKDNKDNFGIIRNINQDLTSSLQVGNGTTWSNMTAQFDPYGSFGYIQPVELGEVSEGEPVVPKVVTIPEIEECVPFEYVTVQNVTYESGFYFTLRDESDNELDGFNRFVISLPESADEDTKYDVTGVVYDDEGFEMWPLSFVVNIDTGIDNIEQEYGRSSYYNMQGISITNPQKGQPCIVVTEGKAKKVIIR